MSRTSCAICLVVILAACGGDSSGPASGGPQALQISGGDQQTGPAGGNPPLPLQVLVTGSGSQPHQGARVTWQVTSSSGGSVNPTSATSDASGHAATVVTLGAPGVTSVRATVGNLAPVAFQINSVNPCSYLAPFGPDTTVNGSLTTSDCAPFGDGTFVDFFGLETTEQRTLVIAMQSLTINAVVLLFDRITGRLIAADDDGGGSPNARLKAILRAGQFVSGANSFNPAEVGPYTLASAPAATAVAGCEDVWVSGGVTLSETITNADCAVADPGGSGRFYYSDGLLIILFAGQAVTITQSSSSSTLNPHLTLFRIEAGSTPIVAEADAGAGTTATLTYNTTVTAPYALDVGTAATEQTGAYTLSIGAITGPAPPVGLSGLALRRPDRLDLQRLARPARPLRRR